MKTDPEFRRKRAVLSQRYMRQWVQKNRKRWNEYVKQYHRQNILKVNGKQIRVRKRPYPEEGKCEICGKEGSLDYHHWNDSNPRWGVWACWRCHLVIEIVDEDRNHLTKIVNKYLDLQKMIETEIF
jgi:hypothetical protein